jgi:Dolichyl-phosphate-mannose-protein mannosyltransferase
MIRLERLILMETPKPRMSIDRVASMRPRQGVRECVAVVVLFWMLAVGLQWKAGAFTAEFGSNPDEAAHYVTGVMIRDYLVSGHLASPMAYATHYYSHYPKVALGVWPPFFHIVEALWTLIFTASKTSVLLLEALIAAALAASVYRVLRRQYSRVAASAGGAMFLLLPLVQDSTQAVMVDGLVALLAFWAMIYLVAFIQSERTRDAVIFGIFAALCVATKPNGVALAFLPVITILITRRFDLLKRRGLYYAAGIVLVIGGPWEVLAIWFFSRSGGVPHPSLIGRFQLLIYYGRVILSALGWGLAPFFLVGLALFLSRIRRDPKTEPMLSGAFSLLLSVWVYHVLIGIDDARYMLSALPAAILFTVYGFAWVARSLPLSSIPVAVRATVLGVLVAAFFLPKAWAVPAKQHWGLDRAAHFLLANQEFADEDFLIVATPCGEGAFVAEVVTHDHRPDHVVLRGTKVLSSSTWHGTNFKFLYPTPEALRAFLDRAPISVVVVDSRSSETGYCRTVKSMFELQRETTQALNSDPNWTLREIAPDFAGSYPGLNLYTRVGPQPTGEINSDLRYTLGTNVVHGPSCERGKRRAVKQNAPVQAP